MRDDLARKMVFIGGPRQVGKTTFALSFLRTPPKNETHPAQLLKYCHWQEDTQGRRMELRYLRDTDKREVDFVVIRDGAAEFAVECKTGERGVSSASIYFKERTAIPAFYQVHLGSKDFMHSGSGMRVLPFERFCKELDLP